MNNTISSQIQEAIDVKTRFLSNNNIQEIFEVIIEALKNGKKVLTCGNGGSTCDAMHFAEELVARYKRDRPAIRALALTDSSTMTCISNDFGYDKVFSRQVEAFGDEGDVLVAISTSGNSQNVILAVEEAKKRGLKVVGFLGKDGGKLKNICDVNLIPPSQETARIQECHMLTYHILCEMIDDTLYPEKR